MISLMMSERHQASSGSRRPGWMMLAFVDLRLRTGYQLDLLDNNNNLAFYNILPFTDDFFLISVAGSFQSFLGKKTTSEVNLYGW